MITLPQPGYMVNINSFIYTTINSITTELDRAADHMDLTLQVIITSTMFGLISNSKSTLTIKLDQIVDQHTSTASSWWWIVDVYSEFWTFFENSFLLSAFTNMAKNSVLDVRKGSENACRIFIWISNIRFFWT